MLRITARFPLGVYHGQSAGSPKEPEWPLAPVRLIGGFLAAAHGRPGSDPTPDRKLIECLCAAGPPTIVAPPSAGVGEPADDGSVVRLRGSTRWAPRNYVKGQISPRNVGRDRAEVSKVGVAIGSLPVHVIWEDVTLDEDEVERLSALASDVTFLGTTRSPVLLEVTTEPLDDAEAPLWTAMPADESGAGISVRVPDELTIAAFDRREAARRSGRDGLSPGRMVPQIAIGHVRQYRPPGAREREQPFDARWWGDALVLAIDPDRSELRPKAPAAYLLARAVRVALLGTYGEPGAPGEAPQILIGRGSDPHCAFVPLPHVWGPHGDGRLLGVAVILPHPRRVPDLPEQRVRVEAGLRRLLEDPDRYVRLPGAGEVRLAVPSQQQAQMRTLRVDGYREPDDTWVTVTPVVHSRWRKGGLDGLLRQVSADCAHVGLPAPVEVELLRGAGRAGGADRVVALKHVPEQWRGPLQGPADHLRITFEQPVRGPLLLGRARHFGLGLCVPGPSGVRGAE